MKLMARFTVPLWGLALGPVLALSARAHVVYVDVEPGQVVRHVQTENDAQRMGLSLRNGFDNGTPFVEVPRLAPAREARPQALQAPGTMDALFSALQGHLDNDADLEDIPYALRDVKNQGVGRIKFDALEDRKAGLFSADERGERIQVNELLNDPAAAEAERWALASVLVHEGRHKRQKGRGMSRVEEEVDAFDMQGLYLQKHPGLLDDAARAGLASGDPVRMKFYSSLYDIVAARRRGALKEYVLAHYRPEDLQ